MVQFQDSFSLRVKPVVKAVETATTEPEKTATKKSAILKEKTAKVYEFVAHFNDNDIDMAAEAAATTYVGVARKHAGNVESVRKSTDLNGKPTFQVLAITGEKSKQSYERYLVTGILGLLTKQWYNQNQCWSDEDRRETIQSVKEITKDAQLYARFDTELARQEERARNKQWIEIAKQAVVKELVGTESDKEPTPQECAKKLVEMLHANSVKDASRNVYEKNLEIYAERLKETARRQHSSVVRHKHCKNTDIRWEKRVLIFLKKKQKKQHCMNYYIP